MTTRIKQLAIEAGLIADEFDRLNPKKVPTPNELQFAALIIIDVLNLIEQRAGGPYDVAMTPETRRSWNHWIEIKEHFGIK